MNIQHKQTPDTESLDHKIQLIVDAAKRLVYDANQVEYTPKFLSRRELQAIIDRHSS